MKRSIKNNRLGRFYRLSYLRLLRTRDSTHKISLGLALGIFLGIMPFAGPLAALFFAYLLRLNRLAAFLGSLLTNTWTSFATFVLSIKIGSAIIGVDWHRTYGAWTALRQDFAWKKVFGLSFSDVLVPVALGYAVISLLIGITAYALTRAVFTVARKQRARRAQKI